VIEVLINKAGGAAKAAGDDLPARVRAAFGQAGAEARVTLLDGAELEPALRERANDACRLVVAGGDGTISCAAGVLAGSDVELAILPLGTLNHLARDAGIPADLDKAAALAVSGTARRIDTGRVGERTFINNASIGIYPALVRSREDLQDRGVPKPLAAIPAAWAALTKAHDLRLAIDTDAGIRRLVTPLLFIGNGEYSIERGSVGCRATLDDGRLSIMAVRHRPRLALAWMALRTVLGRSDPADDFVALDACESVRVEAPTAALEIALDGEVQRMNMPLSFAVRPRSLSLVMPEAAA
jgi:diacylglycerol kinase family enzyme